MVLLEKVEACIWTRFHFIIAFDGNTRTTWMESELAASHSAPRVNTCKTCTHMFARRGNVVVGLFEFSPLSLCHSEEVTQIRIS